MNILITGGSSGLGEAITRKLAQDAGSKIYFTYNQSEAKANDIEAAFPNTQAIKCNFTDTAEVDNLCSKITKLDIGVLINNAYTGTFIETHFHKIPADEFAKGFNENIIPTISITQACINLFRNKKAGKIITVLSAALASVPPVGSAIYVANKAYLKELTKLWAVENVKFNITSNSVSPSFMLTGFTASVDERIVDWIRTGNPSGKLLTPTEVANRIYLLMNDTQQINGTDIIINAPDSK